MNLNKYNLHFNIIRNAEYSLYLENNKFTALCFAILD